MAQKALYDLQLQMTMNSAELSKGLKETNNKLDQFGTGIEKKMKAVQTAFIGAMAVIGSLKGVLEGVKTGMNATGEGADKLEKATKALKGGFEQLSAAIVRGDFENAAASFIRGAKAAAKFTDEIDLMDERLQDLQVTKSRVEGEIGALRIKQMDGTITREEIARLKELGQQLYDVEVSIYDRGIEALKEKIATQLGLNAELLKNLEKGIEERGLMGTTERENLLKSVEDYKAYKKKMEEQFTTVEYFGNGVDEQVQVVKKDIEAITAAMDEYYRNLSGPAQAQVAMDLFGSPEDWNMLIDFLISRNGLQRDYNRMNLQTTRASNRMDNAESSKPDTGHSIETIIPMVGAMAEIPKIVGNIDAALVPMRKSLKETFDWLNMFGGALQEVFSGLGNLIVDALTTPESSFKEFAKAFGKMIMQIIAKLIAMIIVAIIAVALLTALGIGSLGGFKGAVEGIKFGQALGASLKGMTSFADGGLVYGNSIVNVGEYPGAQNNPEVIAPLDKLKGLMGNGINGGDVVFRIQGTELVGILNKQNKINSSY